MTCLSFFLVEAVPQLADALVHERHFHVALVQKLLLLLQLAVLLLVQLIPNLRMKTQAHVKVQCNKRGCFQNKFC